MAMSEETETEQGPQETALARQDYSSDDPASKLMEFLTRCMAMTNTQRAMRIEIRCISDGYRSEPLDSWSREADPELFGNLAHTEAMVAQVVKIIEEHTDAAGEASVFEIKCRSYDQSVKQRKVKVMPAARPNDERTMLLPHETPTGTGLLALLMRHNERVIGMMETQSQSTAKLQRGSVDSILQILKETREENAALRSERTAHLRELEMARSEEADRDMKFAAQEASDKRKSVMTDKFAMILPVLAQAIAGRLTKGKDDKSKSSGTDDPAKPRAKTPLETVLLKFMETMTDDQIAAVKGVLDVEQSLVLGGAINAAEQGGSALLSTMVNDFIASLREQQLIALIGNLNPEQTGLLMQARGLAKAATASGPAASPSTP